MYTTTKRVYSSSISKGRNGRQTTKGPIIMTVTTTEATTTPAVTETPKATKPPVLDSKGTALELGMLVVLPGEDKAVGTITGLEYQRQRVVVKLDTQEKLIVRPASKLYVKKNKSGKIERVERAVRAGKAKATETVEA